MPAFRTILRLMVILPMMLAFASPIALAQSGVRAAEFKLDNGMHVVVIQDNRAPVVTHMVWYRVGAADEPPGHSGIAHFLEHLMFKATDKIPSGQFSKTISRLGGQDNAFTGQDATAYFQRVAKDRLKQVMEMEADRMVNLRLDEAEVLTERNVILEERRSRIDNNPSAILDEQMAATLYLNHPYRIPVIGWEHEMAQLSRQDALTFYKRFYAPNNAILVVSGDVTVEEVKSLATAIYGKIPANAEVGARPRPLEPEHRAPRRLTYTDARAGKPSVQRQYIAPSYGTAKPREAEALDLLMKIVGSGSTSRIYQSLVADRKIAASAGGWYSGMGRDYGKIGLYAVPADGQTLDAVEAAVDQVLAAVAEKGITEEELTRAKTTYLAEYVYESDNQSTLARRYGWALVVGRTVADVEAWPERVASVTVDDVNRAARAHFDKRRSVTGWLVPGPADTAGADPAPRPGRG